MASVCCAAAIARVGLQLDRLAGAGQEGPPGPRPHEKTPDQNAQRVAEGRVLRDASLSRVQAATDTIDTSGMDADTAGAAIQQVSRAPAASALAPAASALHAFCRLSDFCL